MVLRILLASPKDYHYFVFRTRYRSVANLPNRCTMNGLLRKITDFGTPFARSQSEKRNLILGNYAAIVACAALWFLMLALIVIYGFEWQATARILSASFLFFVPIVLNRYGLIVTSRLLLCMLIPLLVFGLSILDLKAGFTMGSSSFVGLRLFLLVGLCFPFLLFDLRQRWLLAMGISFPVLSLVLFDGIFELFGVSYTRHAGHDLYYKFSYVRSLVSAFAIGTVLFLLKFMVEHAERMNQVLMTRLEEQNRIIKRQAEAEVYKLNEELKINLERLTESEYQYRSLFEQASDFIVIFNLKGEFQDVNLSWKKTTGYSLEELEGKTIEDIIDPDNLREDPIRYDVLRSGQQIYSTRKLRRKDGAIIYIESNSKMFQEDKILVIGRDVTHVRETQRQIEISEARFRGAFEESPIGMALASVDGQWLRVNRELCRIFGYREEELLRISVQDLVLANNDQPFDLLRLSALKKSEGVHSERRCARKDGELVWVSLNASLIKDREGLPLYFVVQVEDITDTKEAEEKLRVYEANLRATINNTDVIMWAVNRDFRLIMFNDPFARHFKQRYGVDAEVGSLPFSSIGTPEADAMSQKWRALLSRALAGERFKLEEQRFGMDFQYSMNPIIEGSEVIGVSVFADNVTERNAREKQLNEANKKISELKLMALRSVMSPHFIFNVLNSIQYFIAKNDRLNAINYLSSFSKLVRNILSHSVANDVSLLDEIEMLNAYIQLELIRFENKFTFSLEMDPEIDADSIMIPSLLIQPYVENAILHGLYNRESGGNLSIRIREEDEGTLLFIIEDNGIGRAAAKELRKRNFLPHTPMGINITEERLKLINQGHRTAFEVEDLMEPDGSPAGTCVRIRISYTV